MSKKITLIVLSVSLFAFGAMASECKPRVNGDGRETSEAIAGTETSGAEAFVEMTAARKSLKGGDGRGILSTNSDFFGRELSVITLLPQSATESLVSGNETANAYVGRYCSASSAKNAKCVTVCVRFSNYERP